MIKIIKYMIDFSRFLIMCDIPLWHLPSHCIYGYLHQWICGLCANCQEVYFIGLEDCKNNLHEHILLYWIRGLQK